MAKRKRTTLVSPPFPPLEWDGYSWTCKIVLRAWKGFQTRRGAYGALDSQKESDGTALLRIATPGNDVERGPSTAQAAAFDYLVAQEQAIRDSILREISSQYPEFRKWYFEDYDIEESEQILPVITRPEQLRSVLGLSQVLILTTAKKNVAYVGYEFGCAWESEHGLGFMTNKDRVVKLGGADVSFLEWVAEQDSNSRSPRGRNSGQG
jgi:hypothetical protein